VALHFNFSPIVLAALGLKIYQVSYTKGIVLESELFLQVIRSN